MWQMHPFILWQAVLTDYPDIYPNFIHVVQVLMVIPVSNAIVERGFSSMRRVKDDYRNRLGEKSLENLMRASQQKGVI